MRPVRLLATAAVLAGGLFVIKALEVGVNTADALATLNLSDPPAAEPAETAYDSGDTPALPPNSLGNQSCEAPEEVPGSSGSFALRAENAGLSPSEREILTSLSRRRTALDARERELDTREQLLQAAEIRVDERIEELRTLQAGIEELLGTLSDEEAAEIARLANIYGRMEPDDAADRLAALSIDTQVQLLAQMPDNKASPILAAMEIDAAARLTTVIASRRELPETAADLEARIGTER